MVSDASLSYINHLYRYRDVGTFVKDIEFLISRYQPISLYDLQDSVMTNTKLPKNAVLLTFDDGFKEIYEIVAPILIDKGITATFFITSNLVDNRELLYDNKKSLLIDHLSNKSKAAEINKIKLLFEQHDLKGNRFSELILNIPYNKWNLVDEIASLLGIDFDAFLKVNAPYLTSSHISELLDNGFTFGGHSLDHPRYSELSLDDQIKQTINCIDFLVKKFSLDHRVFAFPYSDHYVSQAFFNAISSQVDFTFGTQGLLTDSVSTNFQRISLEKHKASAAKTIKFHYLRRIIYQLRNKVIIPRN